MGSCTSVCPQSCGSPRGFEWHGSLSTAGCAWADNFKPIGGECRKMFSVVKFSSAVAPRGSLVGALGCCQRSQKVVSNSGGSSIAEVGSSQECLPVYSHVSQGLPCQGWASRLKVVSFDSDESLFYVFICVGVHMRVPQQTLEIREVLFFHLSVLGVKLRQSGLEHTPLLNYQETYVFGRTSQLSWCV